MQSQVLYYNVRNKKRFSCTQDEWVAMQRNPLFRGRFKRLPDFEPTAEPVKTKKEVQAPQKETKKARGPVVEVPSGNGED